MCNARIETKGWPKLECCSRVNPSEKRNYLDINYLVGGLVDLDVLHFERKEKHKPDWWQRQLKNDYLCAKSNDRDYQLPSSVKIKREMGRAFVRLWQVWGRRTHWYQTGMSKNLISLPKVLVMDLKKRPFEVPWDISGEEGLQCMGYNNVLTSPELKKTLSNMTLSLFSWIKFWALMYLQFWEIGSFGILTVLCFFL